MALVLFVLLAPFLGIYRFIEKHPIYVDRENSWLFESEKKDRKQIRDEFLSSFTCSASDYKIYCKEVRENWESCMEELRIECIKYFPLTTCEAIMDFAHPESDWLWMEYGYGIFQEDRNPPTGVYARKKVRGEKMYDDNIRFAHLEILYIAYKYGLYYPGAANFYTPPGNMTQFDSSRYKRYGLYETTFGDYAFFFFILMRNHGVQCDMLISYNGTGVYHTVRGRADHLPTTYYKQFCGHLVSGSRPVFADLCLNAPESLRKGPKVPLDFHNPKDAETWEKYRMMMLQGFK
ncbi:MAG: hypothetical protein LUG57_04160 [Oscillospiraceae bacterium]|nr:hypothetical protein [Oscillospiraceae bacterium]